MYISKMQTDSYCWISDCEMSFAPRVTLIYGKNGSGKSRLIDTVHKFAQFEYSNHVSNAMDQYLVRCYTDMFPFDIRQYDYDYIYQLRNELYTDPIHECFNTFMDGFGDFCDFDPFSGIEKGEGFRGMQAKIFMCRLESLPAGYKRLSLILLDIALGSCMISGNTNAKGVALIDDIDMHLDPESQQTVIERFVHIFPNMQFVMTTKSPIILSHLPQDGNNRIFRIIREGKSYRIAGLGDVYGLDYNSVVSMVMGAHERNPHVKEVKERYVRLMRRGKIDKASLAAEEIKRLFPNNYNDVLTELNKEV